MDVPRQPRADRPHTDTAAELHEEIGYARCEVDAATRRLADLQREKATLARQCEAADREVAQLRHDLERRLAAWCDLDDFDPRGDKLGAALTRFECIRASVTYRAVALLLRVIHRIRRFVTFAWLRRGPPA